MADYQQTRDPVTGGIGGAVLRTADQATIPDDPANRDWTAYQDWLAEGNTPDPPDPLPEPTPPAPLTLEAHPEGPMDAVTKAYVDNAFADLYARFGTTLPASTP